MLINLHILNHNEFYWTWVNKDYCIDLYWIKKFKNKKKIMSVCDNKRDWRIPIPPRSRQPTRAAEDLKMFLYNILFVWFLWLFLWLLLDDAFSFSLCCALKKSSLCATLKGAAAFRSRQDPASPRGRLKIWKCFCWKSCLCNFCGCCCGCC